MNRPSTFGALALASACFVTLSGCVVVPIDPKTGQPYPVTNSLTPPPVVVVQPPPAPPVHLAAPMPTAAAPVGGLINARLYPANDQARATGLLAATVVDNGQGRGVFSVVYGNTPMQGEATRVDADYPGFGQLLAQVSGGAGVNWALARGHRGVANAAGGTISLRCEYLFSRPGQGTGACVSSDGAHFQMHFGG